MFRVAIIVLAFCCLAQNVFAQDAQSLGGVEDPQTITVVTVPKLRGALTFEANLARRFDVFSNQLPTVPLVFGGGVGWRHFFEGHGRLHLRLMGDFEIGTDRILDARHTYIGVTAGIGVRGYTDLFAFGGTALSITGGYLGYTLLQGGDFQSRVPNDGVELGLEYELSFGSIAWSAPFLFAEIALSIAGKWANYGPYSGFFLGGQWSLRFDWAFRDPDFYRAPTQEPWE